MHNTQLSLMFAGIVWLCAAASAAQGPAGELPDPKTGGAAGGPVAILLLSPYPQMDEDYAQEMAQQGFVLANHSYYEPLTHEFVKKFNVIVMDKLARAAEEYSALGQRMVHYWSNMQHVRRCLAEGAGVLVYTNLADCGGALCGGWNKEMKPWGVQILRVCILDEPRSFEKWQAYGENSYCWTENLAKHPVTEGLKRVYYATANLRWDDCYTAPPLVCDESWTPIVKAMPGARLATLVDREWVFEPERDGDFVLAAVRTVEKGRLGVISIHPAYIHRLGHIKLASNSYGEMSYGPVDAVILEKGDGEVPSDTGALVGRMYAWLAGNSAANGFGGFHTGDPVQLEPDFARQRKEPLVRPSDVDALEMLPSWRHRYAVRYVEGNRYFFEEIDPLVKGEVRYFKALVGAHSSLSDGTGTVKDYAAEARKAGYSVIVFTENFEELTRGKWKELVALCEENSTEELTCLPGYDIMDPDGNHLILIAPPEYPRQSWLTADGKRLAKTQMINLLYYHHKVVAHRTGSGPLPYERLKHFQGLSVYTYRDGKLSDDSLSAYVWQVVNGSNPHPIVVHELFSPTEVERAARTGFQQIMPSDTAQGAADYFRCGHGQYFERPARYVISEGPAVTRLVVIGPMDTQYALENMRQFRLAIGVRSEAPLKSVTLYDGYKIVRRWLPQGTSFETSADFQHSHQRGLYLLVEDSRGRRAITNSIRTRLERYHTRCSDRQNWLGTVAAYYTGTFLPERLNLSMPIKGTAEGSGIFTDVPGTCMAMKLNFPFSSNEVFLTEAILEGKYVDALFKDVGFDAMPSKASEPSSVYKGRMRHWSFPPGVADQPLIALVEFDIQLKRDVEPESPGALFPAFGGSRGTKFCWLNTDGSLTSGEIRKDDVLNVPPGGLAGGIVALGEGLQVNGGQLGLAYPQDTPQTFPAGARFTARFLMPTVNVPARGSKPRRTFDDEPEGWLQAMGFAGDTPYRIEMTRGKLEGVAFLATMTPDGFGVAGEVTRSAEVPYHVPMQIQGLNERWPAGSWREGGEVAYTGVFEESAWPRLDVSGKGKFYAGNLLTADDENLVLEVVKWDKGVIKVEAHNPTDGAITTTITTPPEITDHKALSRRVTIPAGSTLYLTEPSSGEAAAMTNVSIAFAEAPQCADLAATLPGAQTPAWRMLLPEWITASNMNVLEEARARKPFPGPFHTVPGTWQVDQDGVWTGEQTHPGVVEITTHVTPRSYYVDLAVTLRNLSEQLLENLYADYCLNANAGGGKWANRDFLPESRLDRAEDGRYWHENVARTGAYVHAGGTWVPFFDRGPDPAPLDAAIIAVTNEADSATLFMMWNAPVQEPWVNNANACMHLRPLFSASLAPGDAATVRGRVGVTRAGREDVWKLFGTLPD